MRILFVTSELFPLVKTGGLGDVCGALPLALAGLGEDVRVLLPAYPGAISQARPTGRIVDLGDPVGAGSARLLEARLPSHPASGPLLYLLDCPALYDREGGPYIGPNGQDWPDNLQRFALLSKVGAMIGAAGGLMGWRPEVVHSHDWQAAPVAAYLRAWGVAAPPVMISIHNLQYQGWFGPGSDGTMGLPADVFGGSLAGWREDQGGTVSFLKAGLLFSHSVSTVSPTYAQEIMTPEGGKGLDGLLHQRGDAVVGILNGIDQQEWDPARDPHIPTAFFAEAPDGKAACRTALRKRFGLKVPETAKQDGVIFGVVSRLADQKGIDLVLAALPSLLAEGGQLVVVGSGDPGMEAELARLSGVFPGQMAVHVGYDETLAHLVFAGSDAILVPSRFEPCGLTQMYAMRYGALPIARRTGGLADSIADLDAPGGGTGVLFDHALPDALAWAVGRMHDLFRRPESLAAARNRAMAEDFGWSRSAERYRQEYRRLIAAAPSPDLAPDQSAAAQ